MKPPLRLKNFPEPLILIPIESNFFGPMNETYVNPLSDPMSSNTRNVFFQGNEVLLNETTLMTFTTKPGLPKDQFSIVMWIKGKSGILKIDGLGSKDEKG